MRNVVTYLVDQYPDLVMTIESIVSEGDTVAVRVFSQGTNLGKLQGVMPPTGKKFSGRQIHWYRAEGGKLAEHWAVREDLETMLQLGVVQRPGPPTP
jgi:predicted ester cyclase